MSGTAPQVFISYSHDSDQHKERVLQLAERLRADGVDAMVDQYVANTGPPQGWPRWMDDQLRDANFVLLICTSVYRRRVEGREAAGRGHGVAWEGNLVYQYIYNAATHNDRFVPVVLDGATSDDVPLPLQGVPAYRPTDDDGYEALYRRLTGQPLVEKGTLGSLRPLPSRRIAVEPRSSKLIERPRARILIGAAITLALLAAASLLWTRRMPGVYQVRVSVVDVHGRPVDDAHVTSSVGGEALRADSAWQFTIPAAARSADGKVIVRAERPAAFQRGETELELGRFAAVTATIQLRADTHASVRGIVVDESHTAIAGARVIVVGFDDHAVTTADGAFSLPAHAADGQQVQIRAHKEGYSASEVWHPAGPMPTTIVLQRAP